MHGATERLLFAILDFLQELVEYRTTRHAHRAFDDGDVLFIGVDVGLLEYR